jgi:hypothetical protein
MPEFDLPASTLDDIVRHPQARMLVGEIIARAYRRAVFATPQERFSLLSSDAPQNSLMQPVTYSQPRLPALTPAISSAELTAVTTGINGKLYKPFYVEDVDKVTFRVGEAADIPVILLKNADKTININKYGRMIKASYEALRYMPIDLLAFAIQRIAIKVEAEKVDDILATIVSGDGNIGTAAATYNASDLDPAATSGALTLKAWLAFKMKYDNPYMLTHVLGRNDAVLKLMMLSMGNANVPLVMAGGLFASQAVTPINNGLADGVRAGWLASAPANALVTFDKRVAIERVFEIGGQIREVDKWITNQTEGLTMTETEGFAIIEKGVTKTLLLQ